MRLIYQTPNAKLCSLLAVAAIATVSSCDANSRTGESSPPPIATPTTVVTSRPAPSSIDEQQGRDTLIRYLRLLHERRYPEGAEYLDPTAYRYLAIQTEMQGPMRDTACNVHDDSIPTIERDASGHPRISAYVRCACEVGRYQCGYGTADVLSGVAARDSAVYQVRFRNPAGELLKLRSDCGTDDCTDADIAPDSTFRFVVRRAGPRYYVNELPPQEN